MTFDPEFLKNQIPYYLTSEDQNALLKELEQITSNAGGEFVLSSIRDQFKNQMIQGDGWTGFEVYDFLSSTKRTVRGMVVSNSCDISTENNRDIPSRIIFAPLVKLSKYKELLSTNGIADDRIDSKIEAIKKQKTTNMFYLPSGNHLSDDYIVRLDDIHSLTMSNHMNHEKREKLFTLNMPGFYMFILKLSVHFCRLHEGIQRSF